MKRTEITAAVAECLVREQFPEWAALPVTPVEHQGWDNTTYRLGDDLAVRLPSADSYVPQVEKEERWLPYLAAYLPLPIPSRVARGVPGCGFPRPWSVNRWLDGTVAHLGRVDDPVAFATDVAAFLRALWTVPLGDGPAPGEHNFQRGAPPAVYGDQTVAAATSLGLDVLDVWEAALVPFDGRSVWLHGDLSASNLLVRDGRLSGVIDFGGCAVGDPACDLTMAWTFFDGAAREAFVAGVATDPGTWARARGWALWKALIVWDDEGPGVGARFGWARDARAVVAEVVAEHRAR